MCQIFVFPSFPPFLELYQGASEDDDTPRVLAMHKHATLCGEAQTKSNWGERWKEHRGPGTESMSQPCTRLCKRQTQKRLRSGPPVPEAAGRLRSSSLLLLS
jgi:hypothetical protein